MLNLSSNQINAGHPDLFIEGPNITFLDLSNNSIHQGRLYVVSTAEDAISAHQPVPEDTGCSL